MSSVLPMQQGESIIFLSSSWHKLLNTQYLQFQQIPLEKRVSCYAPILCRKLSLSVQTAERVLRNHYQLSLETIRKQFSMPHRALWIYATCYLCYLCYSVWNSQKWLLDFLKEIMERMGKNMNMKIFLEFKKTWNLRWRSLSSLNLIWGPCLLSQTGNFSAS